LRALLSAGPSIEEHVFHALAQGHDLGRVQVDAVLGQHVGDRIQQAGAVVGGHRQQVILAALVGPQVHRRLDREGARQARQPALARRRQRCLRLQQGAQLVLDQADDVAVALGEILLGDEEGVERVAVRVVWILASRMLKFLRSK
jgi:hypothetical protein